MGVMVERERERERERKRETCKWHDERFSVDKEQHQSIDWVGLAGRIVNNSIPTGHKIA